jgi:hypothetical protein
MDADGKIPKDLGKKYGAMILAADGFAQVWCDTHRVLLFEASLQRGMAQVVPAAGGAGTAPATLDPTMATSHAPPFPSTPHCLTPPLLPHSSLSQPQVYPEHKYLIVETLRQVRGVRKSV